MGLTDCQKEMIRAVAENDIRKAKRCALASIAEDATQKNREFCIRYRNILTSEGSAMISMPSELQDILLCEDPALSFKQNRYYVTKEQTDLAERILRMSVVSQKLMELQVPYKNATLLYGPPGTGKTMFARYIAYKKGLPFCYLNFSKAVDSYMGATSRNIAKAFTYAASNPCVFLLDEVDAISCNRSKGMSDGASKEIGRVTITLMQEFDRLPNDVIVLGATNRLDILDEAFISRFPVKKEMLPFSEQESKAMVKKFLKNHSQAAACTSNLKEMRNCLWMLANRYTEKPVYTVPLSLKAYTESADLREIGKPATFEFEPADRRVLTAEEKKAAEGIRMYVGRLQKGGADV